MKLKEETNDIANEIDSISIMDKNIILLTIILINIFLSTQITIGGFAMLRYTFTIIMNVMIIVGLCIIFAGLTKKIKVSLVITNTIIMLIAIIDYILVEIRKIPLYFSDIYSIKAAISVLDNYNVEFKWYFYLGIILFIINLILIFKFNSYSKVEEKMKKRYSIIRFCNVTNCMDIFRFINVF